MSDIRKGKIWLFGDDIDTDVIAPFPRDTVSLKEQAMGCMRAVRPEFSSAVRDGDVIVAGKNFGCGSSRETAASYLRVLGIKVVVAGSFGRIFYRNAVNNGILLVENSDIQKYCREGDILTVKPNEYISVNGKAFPIRPLPDHVSEILKAGGLINYMRIQNGLLPEEEE